jgi:hypothetical protein
MIHLICIYFPYRSGSERILLSALANLLNLLLVHRTFEKTRQDQGKVPACRQDAGRALGASRLNSDALHEHQMDMNRPVLMTVRVQSGY